MSRAKQLPTRLSRCYVEKAAKMATDLVEIKD